MSGRHLARHATTETLFRGCKALDFSAMSQALDDGADIRAMDGRWRYPLGVFIEAWRTSPVLPDPSPFVHLLARYGADLARPEGGAGSLHTMGWLRGTDDEAGFFDALVDCGMRWNDMVDDGELLTRVVRHRGPRMRSRILSGPFDVSPDALDEDEQTALHALVDARLNRHHGPRDDKILMMMSTLLDAGASDTIPDIWGAHRDRPLPGRGARTPLRLEWVEGDPSRCPGERLARRHVASGRRQMPYHCDATPPALAAGVSVVQGPTREMTVPAPSVCPDRMFEPRRLV